MPYRPYAPPAPLLFGYDPERDLPQDHLARLVERVVEESLPPKYRPAGSGQPPFDPRLCAKVLIYGYATGVRSSRQLERLCQESLPYLFLTRGDAPSYRTLCSFRVHHSDLIQTVWVGMFAIAQQVGIARLGRIVVDSSKLRADAGPEAVLKKDEYEPVLAELRQILKEAEEADTHDDNDPPGSTRLDKPVEVEQMRDILRRVRKQQSQQKKADKQQTSPSLEALERLPLGPRMLPRLKAAVAAIEEAQQEESKHACLTDPDARMMGEGREKRIRECHSYEVAVDNGLLVVGQTCQSSVDTPRLKPLLEAAQKQEPEGVKALDADCGYYSGDTIAELITQGLDVCIPDPHTACDLHRDQAIGTTRQKSTGSVVMTYEAEADYYTCPEGNLLLYQKSTPNQGQQMRVYRAQKPCTDCPLRAACGNRPDSKYRTLSVGTHSEMLHAHLQRFTQAEHVQRYRQRGPAVETVFGCLRALLGYSRWLLRGKERVASEARLFTAALQIRKIHCAWAKG
jgi:transposase